MLPRSTAEIWPSSPLPKCILGFFAGPIRYSIPRPTSSTRPSSSSTPPIWKLATAAYYSKQKINSSVFFFVNNMFGFGGPTCVLPTSGVSLCSSRFHYHKSTGTPPAKLVEEEDHLDQTEGFATALFGCALESYR